MGCEVYPKMHAFGKDHYKLTRILLSSIGLWPYQSRKIVIMCRFFVCIALAPAPFLLVFKLYSPDISSMVYAEVILFLIVAIVVFAKFLNHCVNIQKIKILIEYMQDDWETLKDKDEIKILQRFTTIGRQYNLFCTCMFMLLPLISPTLDYFAPRNVTRPRQHPFEAEYFVDQEEYFFPILFHMYIVLVTVITIVIATDAIYITCIFHACGMFSIVGFTNTINGAYGWVFFIILVLIIISISITLFNAAILVGEWKEMLLSVIFVSGQMAQVFFNVYPAQYLIDISSKLFIQTYNSQWYMAPIQVQRSILIIMHRCISSSPIVAGRMVVVSMEMYAFVVQTSMSYFTTLYSFKQ